MEHVICEQLQAPLVERIDRFLAELGHRSGEPRVGTLWTKPLPANYRPLKFTRVTDVHLGDIEAVIDGFLVDLYGCQYLLELRESYGPLFPRMRLYEYVMQICLYAEEHYLESNRFFSSTFAELRRILDTVDDNGMPSLLEIRSSPVDYASGGKLVIRGLDHGLLTTTVSEAKIRFGKLADMLLQIAGLLRIPLLTDGVPLRFAISYLYTLLCDRLRLLDQFGHLLTNIKAELAHVNEKFASESKKAEQEAEKVSQDLPEGDQAILDDA